MLTAAGRHWPSSASRWVSNIQVTAWAEPDAFARVLAALALGVLRVHFGNAQDSGIREVRVTQASVMLPPEPKQPNYANSSFTLRVNWTRVWFTRTAPVPVTASIGTGVCE